MAYWTSKSCHGCRQHFSTTLNNDVKTHQWNLFDAKAPAPKSEHEVCAHACVRACLRVCVCHRLCTRGLLARHNCNATPSAQRCCRATRREGGVRRKVAHQRLGCRVGLRLWGRHAQVKLEGSVKKLDERVKALEKLLEKKGETLLKTVADGVAVNKKASPAPPRPVSSVCEPAAAPKPAAPCGRLARQAWFCASTGRAGARGSDLVTSDPRCGMLPLSLLLVVGCWVPSAWRLP